MKYSIIIPTYNHCDDLLKPCIDSIIQYTDLSLIELIVSANGCTDNTQKYLEEVSHYFQERGLSNHIQIIWNDSPLGYSRACNAGIVQAHCDYIILLNNDTVLLPQYQNQWLAMLSNPFKTNKNCGISCLIKIYSEAADHEFAVFFCVMIHKKVFDSIGLLSLDYGVGGGEDIEFSIECQRAGFDVLECLEKNWRDGVQMFSGGFPIYHKGEGTVHDTNLVSDWAGIFSTNMLKLAKKYNPAWYEQHSKKNH